MKWRNALTVAGILTILIALVRWGGTARPGPLFVVGVALLLGLILAFGVLIWWLFFSQLPANLDLPRRPQSPAFYQIIALLVGHLTCAS
jgi:hypothetical protein